MHHLSRRTFLKVAAPLLLSSFVAFPARAGQNRKSSILIVYFSMPETNSPGSMTREEDNSVVVINGSVLGNTQYVAMLIQKMTGGDMFRITPTSPYPTDHATLVDMAREEQRRNARPGIAGRMEHPDNYDTVFLGYPNWWADMPMILYTFLESYDLSGKTVIPFNTHGGSGFSRTIETIAALQPGARVLRNGFSVSRNSVDRSAPDVERWLTEIGYGRQR